MRNVNSCLHTKCIIINRSFILTMRNVNQLSPLVNLFSDIGFYINYEECKLMRKFIKVYFTYCFILTMRNVNDSSSLLTEPFLFSFILTMRNVN